MKVSEIDAALRQVVFGLEVVPEDLAPAKAAFVARAERLRTALREREGRERVQLVDEVLDVLGWGISLIQTLQRRSWQSQAEHERGTGPRAEALAESTRLQTIAGQITAERDRFMGDAYTMAGGRRVTRPEGIEEG